jgi:hypothetical protein
MAMPSAAVAKLRASKARRLQSYPPEHPKVREVGRALDYEMLAEHAARVIADWPTPPPEVCDRIAAILTAGDQLDSLRVLLEPARRELSTELSNGGGVNVTT